MRRDLVDRARRGGREQLVIGGPAALGLVEARDHGLERGHVDAIRAQRRGQRGGEDGLADARVGPGDEEAAQARARARLRGLALDVERSFGRRRGGLARGRHRHALARAEAGLQRRAPEHRAASRSSALLCEAITARRRREVPSGTVGGRMAWAKTPRSIASSQMRIACLASPTTSGTICVVEPATSKPSRASSSRRASPLAWSFSTRWGCSVRSSSAASAPATAGGGGAVEKMNGRAVLTR